MPRQEIAKPQSASRSAAAARRFDMRRRRRLATAVAALALSLVVALFSAAQIGVWWSGDPAHAQGSVRPPSSATENATPGPTDGGVLNPGAGLTSDSGYWRSAREGERFTSSARDPQSATLIQSEGAAWRAFRNGPLLTYGAYAMGGVLAVLALFYLLRGRIRIEAGRSSETITRFNTLERFGHWLLAGSFIILAITGLNLMYGRELLLPLIGHDAFAVLSNAGKWLHNNVGWAFMLGLALVFFMWVLHNIPSWRDVVWIAKGGGLFVRGVHVDSRRFNAGQKIIFWATILGGASLSASGIALLFPYETAMFAKTFGVINSVLGTTLPTELTALQEQQLQTLWHGIVAIVMIVIIVAHIYIGSLGMEGAFAAMGSGEVDLNWAREHHNLWVEEEAGRASGRRDAASNSGGATAAPAE